jgi:hypothetical protein
MEILEREALYKPEKNKRNNVFMLLNIVSATGGGRTNFSVIRGERTNVSAIGGVRTNVSTSGGISTNTPLAE